MVDAAQTALDQTGTDFDPDAINTALEAIKTAATAAITIDTDVETAIGNIGVNATDTDVADREKRDFKTANAVFEEVQALAVGGLEPVEAKFVADIFTFGADENHAIYRALLEETGDGTAVFEGTVEYQILNQKTVDEDQDTHGHNDHRRRTGNHTERGPYRHRRTDSYIRRRPRERGRTSIHR